MELDWENQDQAERQQIVAQALDNVRARGIEPHYEVLALYDRYAAGELTRREVQAAMQARAAAIQQQGATKGKKALSLGAV